MKRPEREDLYAEVVEAARQQTDRGIDAEQARQIERAVRHSLSARATRRGLWSVPVAAATAAAMVTAVVLWSRGVDPPAGVPPTAPVAPEPVTHTVVFLRGAVERTTELAPNRSLQLAAGSRVDLATRDGRVSVRGPARIATDARGRLLLTDGAATFDIPKRSHAPLVVGCGKTEVVVVGTTFTVRATAGKCDSVRVEKGRVTVRHPRPLVLGPGEAYYRSATSELAPAASQVFAAPWWSEVDGPTGYLAVETEPDGADARLDGHALGRTPVLVRWRAGEARLAITRPGFQRSARAVSIPVSAIVHEHVRLGPVRAAEPAPPALDLWEEARALLATARCERLEAMIRTLVAAARTDVERARAGLLPAECALRQGQRQRALARYQTLVDRYPATPSAEAARFETVKLQFELGRFAAALAAVDAYLAEHPDGRFAQAAEVRRCEILVELGKIEIAVTCLTRYRADRPAGVRHFHASLLLATIERRRGAWQRAADLYRELAQRAPDSPHAEEVLYRRAQCLAWGRLAGAVAAAREYLVRFPRGAYADEVRAWAGEP